MKTFLTLMICSFGLVFTTQAQDKAYQPNARQAIQKSRMQQPQYYEVTRDMVSENKVQPSDNKDQEYQDLLESSPAPKVVNYQLERPVAIDAPKRRGRKPVQSSYTKLASYNQK